MALLLWHIMKCYNIPMGCLPAWSQALVMYIQSQFAREKKPRQLMLGSIIAPEHSVACSRGDGWGLDHNNACHQHITYHVHWYRQQSDVWLVHVLCELHVHKAFLALFPAMHQ
jgi:hypothetical protein